MATIAMPQLGETVTEGTVARWLKAVGESIEKYEPFVEVSTDKVNAEVPSPVAGVLREIVVAEGDTVPTGATIAIIEEVAAAPATKGAPPGTNGASPAKGDPVPTATDAEVESPTPATAATPGANGRRHERTNGSAAPPSAAVARTLSPAVRRLVRERGVDVAILNGSGANGRVTVADVLAATTSATPASPTFSSVAAPSERPGRVEAAPATGTSSYERPIPGTVVPLTPVRKLIAQRMTEALATAPHAWTMVEVDVSAVWAWRSAEKDRFARERGYALTLLPFFASAVVSALRAHPLVNARFAPEGIVVERDVNLGIAIGFGATLVVPVIRNADRYSIGGLAIEAGRLIEKAKSGKLAGDDMTGGTFTVNNTGANGSVLSKPIINGGQAAIVTMEAIVKRPVVVDDAIAIRRMMNVCLSLDHRVLDGSGANAFLVDLKRRLEAMRVGGSL